MTPNYLISAFLVVVICGAASAQRVYFDFDDEPFILSEDVSGLDELTSVGEGSRFGELYEVDEKLEQSAEPSVQTSPEPEINTGSFVVPLRVLLRGDYVSPLAYSMYQGGGKRYLDVYNRVVGNKQRYTSQRYAAPYGYQ